MAQHWLFDKFKVNELASLLITFSFAVILEVAIQLYWTADYRRFETHYSTLSIKVGPFYIPVLELVLCMVAGVLAWGTWLWLRQTYVGKALRAAAEDPDIAAAYGVDHKKLAYLLSGMGAAYAAIAGTFIALIATLAPTQIWAYLGVVFAVVIIGRLGNPLGALLAGMLIGASESIAMAVFEPGLGAGRVVLGADRHPAVGSGMAVNAARDLPKAAAAAAIVALAFLPMAQLPAFYESFIYLIFFWVSLSTSWALLSGFAGYFSLGHAAFFGVGVYTTADAHHQVRLPFLADPADRGRVGSIAGGRHRRRRLPPAPAARRAVRAADPRRHLRIATIILNTPIDGGGGVFMSAVPLPDLMPTPTGTIYILGFVMCVLTLGHCLVGRPFAAWPRPVRHP